MMIPARKRNAARSAVISFGLQTRWQNAIVGARGQTRTNGWLCFDCNQRGKYVQHAIDIAHDKTAAHTNPHWQSLDISPATLASDCSGAQLGPKWTPLLRPRVPRPPRPFPFFLIVPPTSYLLLRIPTWGVRFSESCLHSSYLFTTSPSLLRRPPCARIVSKSRFG